MPRLFLLVAVELVGVDAMPGHGQHGGRGRLRGGLALGEEAAQAGVFGGACVEGGLKVIGPHGLLFGPDAVGDGLHVFLPGVPAQAGAGHGEENADEEEHVGVGDHRRVLPPMWCTAQAPSRRRAVRWSNWLMSMSGARLVVTKIGMLRDVR